MLKLKTIICSLIIFTTSGLLAQESPQDSIDIGIDEKLGEYIAEDAVFKTSTGESINLKESLDKPAVIALVYYKCPGICSPLLDGFGEVIQATDLEPGVDYNAYAISFDHNEGIEDARKWKKNYVAAIDREIQDDGWRFLTGDSVNIRKLTESVGFKFTKQGDRDYLHGGALVVISPKGKITRYHRGTDFLPFNFKMSIYEAGKEEAQPTVAKLLQYCFKFDTESQTWTLNLLNIMGAVTMLFVGGFIVFLVYTTKKERKLKEIASNG